MPDSLTRRDAGMVFSFGANSVRIVMRDGEPWFVAQDVVRILDIGNKSDAARRLDDDEKGVDSIDTPGGPQRLTVVSESGLYSLVLGSRKPEAREFKRWVMREVLPSIRKTGSYGQADPVAMLSDPATLRALLGSYAERTEKAEAALAIAAPKAEVFDAVIDCGDTFGFREAAQQVRAATGANENVIRGWMLERGWIQRLGGQLAPASYGLDLGYVSTRERPYVTEKGEQRVRPELRVTPKGIARAIVVLNGETR